MSEYLLCIQSIEVCFALGSLIVQYLVPRNFMSTHLLNQLPQRLHQEFPIHRLRLRILIHIIPNSNQICLGQFLAKTVIAHHSKLPNSHLSNIIRFFNKYTQFSFPFDKCIFFTIVANAICARVCSSYPANVRKMSELLNNYFAVPVR